MLKYIVLYHGGVYTIGNVYLVLNLPGSLMLLGIIPGPSEPPLTVNSYLSALVTELLQLWQGDPMQVSSGSILCVQHYILPVAYDPQLDGRSVGFLVIQITLDVLVHIPTVLCSDYSCVDRSSRKMRSNQQHQQDTSILTTSTTMTDMAKTESKLGCRFSVL